MTSRIITIFGGTGFIGRHLVRALAQRGDTIRIATRDIQSVRELKTAGSPGQIVALRCKPWDAASVASAVAGSDSVINLIGILFEKGPNTFDRCHVVAPGLIARVATQAGVKNLVHISAIGANTNSPSAYARSKASGEAAVRTGFPDAVILRPSIIFGPEDGFFNRLARMTLWSGFMPLIGGGATKFQPVYVGDVVHAILAALDNSALRGQTYELGGPGVYTFRQLTELVMRETGRWRKLVMISFKTSEIIARIMEFMPTPMLTRDQILLLYADNVVASRTHTLSSMGISLTALEAILPAYLSAYHLGGRFNSALM